jgi:ATP-dependent DNA helicase RecG
MNLMFERASRQGKPLPSFAGTSSHEVRLTLEGTVRSPAFVRFMERLGEETLRSFATADFLALDCLRRERPLPEHLKVRLPGLIAVGAVESIGRGKGTRHLLSQRFYAALGTKGVYTRVRGLDRETNKALLERHLLGQGGAGSPLSELRHVLPSESENGIQRLLDELRSEGRVILRGQRRRARWVIAASKATARRPDGKDEPEHA